MLPLVTLAQKQTTITLNEVAPHIPVWINAPSDEVEHEKMEAEIHNWANEYQNEFIALWEQAVIAYEKGNTIAIVIEQDGKTIEVSSAYNSINWEEGFDIRTAEWAELTERLRAARIKPVQRDENY